MGSRGASSSYETPAISFGLDVLAFRLIEELQLRLVRLHETGDPHASALAAECEEVLEVIRSELKAAAEESADRSATLPAHGK